MKQDKSISVVLPVHNQENIIGFVIKGIVQNKSENVKELLIIMDGCTDNSQREIDKVLPLCEDIEVKIIFTPDVWETKASNVGYMSSQYPYILAVQDDMIITEFEYDKRLMKPFENFDNIFAVTARDAVDCNIDENGKLKFVNVAGKDVNTSRDLFCIRDIINRGPVLFDHEKLKQLNYLDEIFSPQGQDDTDICWRAYKKGWLVGSYRMDYDSDDHWGGTRKNVQVTEYIENIYARNCNIIINRYKDLILAPKHSQDIELE
jgi:glycosyltransferase involved in cell wall biosynthesis